MSITTDALHELFEYKEGKLYRKTNRGRWKKDTECTCLRPSGYKCVVINYKTYLAHRIIYQMFHGAISRNKQIDHIDRDRGNNNIENLRLVSNMENQWNRGGVQGYSKIPNGKYVAKIMVNTKAIQIGTFTSEEEAREAYITAKNKYHIIGDN